MDSNVTYEVNNGLAAGVMIVIWLFALALAVLVIIGLWKTFRKAGLPGWAAIIPFYNEYNVVKMSNRPIWFFWAMLGCSLFAWIPFLGWLLIIGIIVLWVFVALDIAANFGQGTGLRHPADHLPVDHVPDPRLRQRPVQQGRGSRLGRVRRAADAGRRGLHRRSAAAARRGHVRRAAGSAGSSGRTGDARRDAGGARDAGRPPRQPRRR